MNALVGQNQHPPHAKRRRGIVITGMHQGRDRFVFVGEFSNQHNNALNHEQDCHGRGRRGPDFVCRRAGMFSQAGTKVLAAGKEVPTLFGSQQAGSGESPALKHCALVAGNAATPCFCRICVSAKNAKNIDHGHLREIQATRWYAADGIDRSEEVSRQLRRCVKSCSRLTGR
jgi:hypothetical protein